MPEFRFDLEDGSVSVPGSLLALTGVGERTPSYRRNTAASGLYLRSLRTRDPQGFLFHLTPTLEGRPIENPKWIGLPGCAVVREGNQSLSIRFTTAREIVIEARGIGLQAKGFPGYFDWVRPLPNQRSRYHATSQLMTLDMIPRTGRLDLDAPWDKIHSTRVDWKLALDQNERGTLILREREPQTVVFDDSPDPADTDPAATFKSWAEPLVAGLPDRLTALRAAHILWAHQTRPDGLLPGRVIVAGKSWMPSAYGWDQCFCAAGIAHADPELAWEQLAVFFHAQRADGVIPALLHPDRVSWGTMMPPLQGWCLRRLRKVPGCITTARLAWIAPRLEAYVRWWLQRDEDGDGAPEYHHGNDSGWDNGTSFENGVPVACPDLIAHLVECCTALAEAYGELGDNAKTAAWKAEESRLVSLLASRFVEGDRLVARRSVTGEIPNGDSLLPLLGLLVGKRLPEKVIASTVAALADPERFLAPFGFATEALSSPYHASDSYWRGPVWAPTTWLMAEALEAVGAGELAREALARFCKACAQDAMAENFDPISGRGLRDRSYAWTAAVYLLAQRRLYGAVTVPPHPVSSAHPRS